ncbi:MAG: hemin uptake protein HemP [Alphaproteobacteria bacterium]|nr:hemin uptake protein HemP [Alphaproteobacteria bacterium]
MHRGDRQPELSLRRCAADGNNDDTGGRPDARRTSADREPGAASRNPHAGRSSRPASVRRIGSRELMGASGQLVIRHAGDDYHLRVTSKGKLILTK